jgi:hypothetical protein
MRSRTFGGLEFLSPIVLAAWRRKSLEPESLPVQVVALDGKATSLPTLNHPLVRTTSTARWCRSDSSAR